MEKTSFPRAIIPIIGMSSSTAANPTRTIVRVLSDAVIVKCSPFAIARPTNALVIVVFAARHFNRRRSAAARVTGARRASVY